MFETYDKESLTPENTTDDQNWLPIETAPKDGTKITLRSIQTYDAEWHNGHWKTSFSQRGCFILPQPTQWKPINQ